MRKFYQTEWYGIQFCSFTTVSSSTIARSTFYDAFYNELFKRYDHYDSLCPEWRRSKDKIAEAIVERISTGKRVLSVGCGLGYIEQKIWRENPNLQLHITDFSAKSMQWLAKLLPFGNIHHTMPNLSELDLIYFVELEYAMSDDELIEILRTVRQSLSSSGKVLMITSCMDDEKMGMVSHVKSMIKGLLFSLGIRDKGQFWGYKRTKKELMSLFSVGGFTNSEAGFTKCGSFYVSAGIDRAE